MAKSDFAKQLKKEIDAAVNDQTSRIKKAAIELCSRIVFGTPVDTSNAASSWTFSIGAPVETYRLTGNPKLKRSQGQSIISQRREAAHNEVMQEVNDTITEWNILKDNAYFANGAEYIDDLEFGKYEKRDTKNIDSAGFSRQAPGGMVRVNVNDWENLLAKHGIGK